MERSGRSCEDAIALYMNPLLRGQALLEHGKHTDTIGALLLENLKEK
jgi:hypothetical protein